LIRRRFIQNPEAGASELILCSTTVSLVKKDHDWEARKLIPFTLFLGFVHNRFMERFNY
jgi:hypothetical protein